MQNRISILISFSHSWGRISRTCILYHPLSYHILTIKEIKVSNQLLLINIYFELRNLIEI